MVEDRRHALLDGVHVQRGGGRPCAVHHQMAVDGPPRAVKDFVEVRRVVADDGKAAGEGGVDVRVRVDERGHDDAAPGVNDLGVGILGAKRCFLADFDDLRALEGDGTVLVIALRVCVAGDETTVGDKFHKFAPPFSFAFSPPQSGTARGKKKRSSHRPYHLPEGGDRTARARSTTLQLPNGNLVCKNILQESRTKCTFFSSKLT